MATPTIDADDWSVDSNDALSLSLISSQTGEPITEPFEPVYTYPLYGESQAIFGYKDLSIRILFAADDMEPCVLVNAGQTVLKVGEIEAEDVLEPLRDVLPESAFTYASEAAFTTALKGRTHPFTPPGTLLTTYTTPTGTYSIYRTPLTTPPCRRLLSHMQLLVLLYIEGGTLLELEDEDWSNQRWEILFLYGPSQTFIGYATLYRYLFFSLERSDLSRLRLSQFLILPPFQRQGHGSRFYDAIMTHYLPQDTITELTVEDPSESFSDLRDRRDLLRLSHHPAFASLTLASATPEALTTIRKEAKMPLRQFLRCVEMKLLRDLETPNKAFRILVKRRIYKQHADVLAQLDRLERIDKLDETYHHVEDDYRRLLKGMENERVEEEEEENAKRGSVGGEEGRPKKRVRVLEE